MSAYLLDSDLSNETFWTSVSPLLEDLAWYLHLTLNAPRMLRVLATDFLMVYAAKTFYLLNKNNT